MKQSILLTITIVILSLLFPHVRVDARGNSKESIRVAVVKGAERVRVTSGGVLGVTESGKGVVLGERFEIRADRDGIRIDDLHCRRIRMSGADPVGINDRRYRGIIEVTRDASGGILVVNELPLEEYLVGLINCEISSHWPMDALKAQAVVARSYALYQKRLRGSQPYHLESTVLDQVYAGSDQEDLRSRRAVEETAGEVLTYDGEVIQAFYHSSCGGATETPDEVWGVSLPYLRSVVCRYCLESPSVAWEQTLSLRTVESALKLSRLTDLRIAGVGENGRVRRIELVTQRGVVTMTASAFRRGIGYSVIRSTRFSVERRGNDFLFRGAGSGHGVGLCQWGARERALEGFDYREILSYYYPRTKLTLREGREE